MLLALTLVHASDLQFSYTPNPGRGERPALLLTPPRDVEELYLHCVVGDTVDERTLRDLPGGVQQRVEFSRDEGVTEAVASDGGCSDGFPRAIRQAWSLEAIANVVAVISIEVPDAAIVERIVGRRMDPETGGIYHVNFNPAPPEIVSRLIQRQDDNEETVLARLAAYHEQTAPLAAWYGERDLLVTIDGNHSIDEVAATVEAVVRGLA